MNRKGELTIGVIVLLIVGVVVALALLPQIAANTQEMTKMTTIASESMNIAACRNGTNIVEGCNTSIAKSQVGWNKDNCPIAGVIVKNQTGGTLTLTTNYEVDKSLGYIRFIDTAVINTSASNITTVTYDWCAPGYVSSGAGRSIAGLILIFAALGLLAFVVWYGIKEYL